MSAYSNLDYLTDWLWEQDVTFRFTLVSEVTPSPPIIDHARYIGKALWELPCEEVTEEEWRIHRAALIAHEPFHEFAIKCLNADGNPDYLIFSGEPVFDAAGTFQGYRGTCKIITKSMYGERKLRKINAELEQRVALLSQCLNETSSELKEISYCLSHDLRAPLRGIEGFSHILLTKHADQLDAIGQDYLRRIRRACLHLGEQIHCLINLAQITRDNIRPESVDLSRITRDILTKFRAVTPERKVEIEIEEGIVVMGDHRLLHLALEKLLDNAWKFTSKNSFSSICFGTAIKEGGSEIFVRDNGIGFDQKYAHNLFHPFQRIHTGKEFSGTGIGLATVRRVVHAHGGQIRAEAQPGAGSTFYFTVATQSNNDNRPNKDSAKS